MLVNGIANKKVKRKELDDFIIGVIIGRNMLGNKNLDVADMAKVNVSTPKTIRTRYTKAGTGLAKKSP